MPVHHKDLHKIKNALHNHHKQVIEHFEKKHSSLLHKARLHGMSIASGILLTSTLLTSIPALGLAQSKQHDQNKQKNQLLLVNPIEKVKNILGKGDVLTEEQEKSISQELSRQFKISANYTLDDNRLNEIYGYTGAEQHLYRWAGDSLSAHENLLKAGIAPLQGAFKDFDNAEQEKYYVAVQLHELPNWNTDWVRLKPWYRYRKVLVYNPDNGKAVVAVIGDAGPSKWTGKTFGGSPEVMQYLERVDGKQKGKVVILFVDDPDNKVSLGPIKL